MLSAILKIITVGILGILTSWSQYVVLEIITECQSKVMCHSAKHMTLAQSQYVIKAQGESPVAVVYTLWRIINSMRDRRVPPSSAVALQGLAKVSECERLCRNAGDQSRTLWVERVGADHVHTCDRTDAVSLAALTWYC